MVRALDWGLENSDVSVYHVMGKFFSDPSLTVYNITLILCEPYAYKVYTYIHLTGYKENPQKLSMITMISAVWT